MISRIKTGSVCSILVLCALVFLPNIQVNTQPVVGSSNQGTDFVPGEVLVKFRSNAKEKNIVDVNGLSVSAKTIKSSKQTDSAGFVKLDLSDKNIDLSKISGLSDAPKISKEQTLEAIKTLKSNPNVEYAEPNYIVKAMAYTSNDPLYLDGTQWGLNNTGQDSGTADKDVNAPEAWDVIGNTAGPKIAILDSGVDYLHEDLAGNIDLINQAGSVVAGNIRGYNFCPDSSCSGVGNNDPMDNFGHGTEVAGVAAAVGQNSKGVIGACPKCKIMPVKVLDSVGLGTVASVTSGIYYAIDNGAKIINMSLGAGGFYSQSMHNAIAQAKAGNIIVVAAAGNCGNAGYFLNGCSSQNQVVYPGSDENVIAVGSVDRNGSRSSFSNVGSYVSVVAPGSDITSTCLNSSHDNYCSADGTSAATPFVAGGIGLLASENPTISFEDVRYLLTKYSSDLGTAGFDNSYGWGLMKIDASVNATNSSNLNTTASYINTPRLSAVKSTVDLSLTKISQTAYNTRIYQSAIASDSKVYTRSFDGTNWTVWSDTGSTTFPVSNTIAETVFNSKLYQAIKGSDNKVYTRSFDGTTWSNWSEVGGGVFPTSSQINQTALGGRLYQSAIGFDSRVYTRSFDGTNWSGWFEVGGGVFPAGAKLNQTVISNRLYQSSLGFDTRVYTRSFDGTNWTGWSEVGGGVFPSGSVINQTAVNNRLYQSILGFDNKVYTRYFDGSRWFGWSEVGGVFPAGSAINQTTLNNRLYQSILGFDNKVYTRYFDGTNWTGWFEIGGGVFPTGSIITQTVLNNKLYQSAIGFDSNLYTRLFDNFNTSAWELQPNAPRLTQTAYNTRIYQSAIASDSKVYTRSFDGTNWTGWSDTSSTTFPVANIIAETVFNSKLYQAIKGSDNKVYTRSFDGTNWTIWSEVGGGVFPSTSQINQVIFSNKIYQSLLGFNSRIYTRSFDGTNWSGWSEVGGGVFPSTSQINQTVYGTKLYQSALGFDSKIYTRSFDGTNWSGLV